MIFASKSGFFSRCRTLGVAFIAVSSLIGNGSVGVAQTNSPPPVKPTDWQVSLDEGQSWHPIQVPGTIEDQQDARFDGVVKYRTSFQAAAKDGQRAWLRFQAVATEATVWLDGQQLGTHLGGWKISPATTNWSFRSTKKSGITHKGFCPSSRPTLEESGNLSRSNTGRWRVSIVTRYMSWQMFHPARCN